MKALTAEEYDKQYQEHLKQGGEELFNHDGFDYIVKCEDRFAKEYNSFVELRRGLELFIQDEKFHRDRSIWGHHDEEIGLYSDFLILGNLRTITPGIREIDDDYLEMQGHHYLFYLPNIDEIEQPDRR